MRTRGDGIRLERKNNSHIAVNYAQVFKCFPKLKQQGVKISMKLEVCNQTREEI